METLTDEQYQQFLDIYDQEHEGLTWDASEGAYRVAPDSPWDDEILDGVRRTEDGTWVDGDVVSENFAAMLEEAGFTEEMRHACQERLAAENR